MNIMMEQEQQVPHVAEVYQPRQHPTHKYWTLPRSIATGLPIPNGGPYIERQTSETEVTSVVFDEVDRFNQHHEQLQQTRIKEIAEQHMKPIASTTTTTASATTVQEEISKGFSTTLTASSSSKQIIQQVVARDKPPEGATLLYETEDATFYTIPVQDDQQELDQGVEATSSKTVRTTTYAVPKKKLDEGIGPLNESGVPITPKAGVKSEHGSEWYKAWVRKMHKMERAGRDDSSNSVCVKVKSPRYKGSGGDYHLAVEGEGRGSLPKYVPGNIADYEPGRTSIFERERQLFYHDIFNYIDSMFAEVLASTAVSANQKFQTQLRKRAKSLSRMGSEGIYAHPSSVSAHGPSAEGTSGYGTIKRPSRSMPSLRTSPLFVDSPTMGTSFYYPPPPTHAPIPPPAYATLARTRRLSMPGKLGGSMGSASGKKVPGKKRTKKSSSKTRKPKKKKKKQKPKPPTVGSSDPTSSDQPEGGAGGGDGAAGDEASGNISDDEREEDDDDEGSHDEDDSGSESSQEEDDDEVDDNSRHDESYDEEGLSHEADVEDNTTHVEENFPQPQTSSQPPTGKSTTASSSYYHENCVFNQLTGQKGPGQTVGGGQGSSVSGGSGYDSDSSYIIKKNKPKLASKPASPAVYRAVQRGEDIPLQGLARPTPPKQMPRKAYQQDYDEPEYESEDVPEGAYSGTNGYGKSKSRDEWNQLDEWQSQIETDFDYIYSTLQSVGSKSSGRQPKTSTPYPEVSKRTSSLGSSSTTTTQKKSVAFNDREEIQMIEEIEDEIDAGSYDLMNGNGFGDEGEIEDEVEEEEYSYAGLLRPGSHKPMGTAKSLDHFLNTQDLNKNVQKLKTPSGADDRIRVRKHRRRRSRSPGGSKSPSRSQTRESEDRDSDYAYDKLPPSYYLPSANKTGSSSSGAQDPIITQRTTTTTIYAAQPNEGKLNVQYRMPTNKFGVAGDLDITTASTTSTVTAKNTGRYGYGSGVTSPAGSTTLADSSFSTIVKQPLQPSRPTSTPTGTLVHAHRGPCGEEDSHQHQKGYRMERHHYMPTAMSPVALDRYERAFTDNKENEPKKIARVIYDFQALGRNELAVKKGDLVVVRKSVNPNWVEVEDSASGLVGFVPRTYLDFEQHGIAKARFDFIAKTNVEISFKKGEKLTLLRRVDSNWYEGINEKQDVGIFPVTYVEAIKQPIGSFLDTPSSSTAPPAVLGGGATSTAASASGSQSSSAASLASIISIDDMRRGKGGSGQQGPMHSTLMLTPSSMTPSPSGSMSISLASLPHHYQQQPPGMSQSQSSSSASTNRPLPPSCTPSLTPVTPSSILVSREHHHYPPSLPHPHHHHQQIYFSSTTSEPGAYHHIRRAPDAVRHFGGSGERFCLPKPRIYRVLYPYKPQQMDEIELQYGDLLTVTIQCDDGWFLGRSTLSGKFGTFPGNYVEPV